MIIGVDVGYGNVKYAWRRKDGTLAAGHFPSIAALTVAREFSDGATEGHDAFRVEVGQESYVVGVDAELALAGHESGRILNRAYHESNPYLALFRGALAYLGKPLEVDLLVTGLPVEFFRTGRERLEDRLTGEHPLPGGSITRIKQAWVIPQPVGGFLHHAIVQNIYQDLRSSLSLIVDCGFFTVDWIVTKGLKVAFERSGSTPGGVSQILAKLAQAIADEVQEPFNDVARLDDALRNGHRLELYGRPFNFGHLLPRVRPVMDQVCQRLLDTVGAMSDIGTVVLVGGGAPLYQDAIRKICKRNPLVLVKDPMHANVKGFYLAGEERLKNDG
ncbi:PRTRC system protein D [Methylocaldum szegediense]|uniref:PRTRC system protein D n=1 Tax=Methylocaldum szegediense TaxID=73780 RepID=UPI0004270B04|nr:PRTRC system protein D [Methylocaldum szegediense]